MVPLPPSPMIFSPQPVNFPASASSTARTIARDLPLVPEAASDEPEITHSPSLADEVHTSEFEPVSREVNVLDSPEVSNEETPDDATPSTPVIPQTSSSTPMMIPGPLETEPILPETSAEPASDTFEAGESPVEPAEMNTPSDESITLIPPPAEAEISDGTYE